MAESNPRTLANPIPLALIGVGAGWLILSRTSGAFPNNALSQGRQWIGQAADTVRHTAEDVRKSVGHTAESVRQRFKGTAEENFEKAARYAQGDSESWGNGLGLYDRSQQITRSLWNTLDEHPVAVGLMGVALGAAIGASLPPSRAEEEWLGDIGRNVLEGSREAVNKASDKVRTAAQVGLDKAKESTGNPPRRM